MRIDLNGTIAGVPVRALRKALKDRAGHEWHGGVLADELAVADARTLLDDLEREGLIKRKAEPDIWINTMHGNALAQARGRRVSREVAERHVSALLERTRALRTDPRFLWRVHRISVFGSYLNPNAADVGDVDVVIELATKEPNWERHVELERAYTEAEYKRGRSFSTFFDGLTAPRTDPRKFLKGRSPVLSIHGEDEYRVMPKDAFAVIYEDPIDEPERTLPGTFSKPR